MLAQRTKQDGAKQYRPTKNEGRRTIHKKAISEYNKQAHAARNTPEYKAKKAAAAKEWRKQNPDYLSKAKAKRASDNAMLSDAISLLNTEQTQLIKEAYENES